MTAKGRGRPCKSKPKSEQTVSSSVVTPENVVVEQTVTESEVAVTEQTVTTAVVAEDAVESTTAVTAPEVQPTPEIATEAKPEGTEANPLQKLLSVRVTLGSLLEVATRGGEFDTALNMVSRVLNIPENIKTLVSRSYTNKPPFRLKSEEELTAERQRQQKVVLQTVTPDVVIPEL